MERLGEYELIKAIGEGGMSTVYRAHQPSMERDVAIKVISDALSGDPDYLQRFRREARINAKLQHPHIIPIHAVGQVEGRAYLVMAYMGGGSLDRLMADNLHGLPLPQVVRIVRQIASAIDAVHEVGVTHCDLKPGNILLDERGNAYLSDFGIARMAGDPSVPQVPGTYAYVAPEVALGGASGQLGDIYALGVVTFELLTGLTPLAIVDAETMVMAHTEGRPRRLSSWRPDLPPGVEVVVRQALHPDPDARPRTAMAFAKALERAAAEPQPSSPPLSAQREPGAPPTDETPPYYPELEATPTGQPDLPPTPDMESPRLVALPATTRPAAAPDVVDYEEVMGARPASDDGLLTLTNLMVIVASSLILVLVLWTLSQPPTIDWMEPVMRLLLPE